MTTKLYQPEQFQAAVKHQEEQARKAATILRSAADQIEAPDGEPLADRGLRLRGAAILAISAGQGLSEASAWLAAAHQATESGMLEPVKP